MGRGGREGEEGGGKVGGGNNEIGGDQSFPLASYFYSRIGLFITWIALKEHYM